MVDRQMRESFGPEGAAGRVPARWDGRLLFGLVLLTFGVLLTLDQLDLMESGHILQWWPVILIAVGVVKLLGLGTTRHVVWGTMFTVFGVLFLGDTLDRWNFEFWNFWPLVMIFIGASLLMKGLRRGAPGAPAPGEPVVDTGAEFRSFALMSGVTRRITSSAFRGAELSAVMGGVEIDFRNASLQGGVAVIEVFVWWGGIDIKVPEGWGVANEGLAVMGAIEDSTKSTPDGRNTLVVRGLVVMGGVDIKN